jgi:uncharacterized phosphosugar-binding protein
MANSLQGAQMYIEEIRSLLDKVALTQKGEFDKAATRIFDCFKSGGMLYLFGTGHSHMLAEEGHTRAGGFAPVCPILLSSLMLHESAIVSGKLERTVGIGSVILEKYKVNPNDILIIFSNSGVNAVPVELAIDAKRKGLVVIAVTALKYATMLPLGIVGQKLPDIADIVIDNCSPPGDALVEVTETGVCTGPGSTVVGAFILNTILTEVAFRLAVSGYDLPIYISGNMPGANQKNAELIESQRILNPHI